MCVSCLLQLKPHRLQISAGVFWVSFCLRMHSWYLVSFSEMSVMPAGVLLGEQWKPRGHSLRHVCVCRRSVPVLGAQAVPVRCEATLSPRRLPGTNTSDPPLRLTHRLFLDTTVPWIHFVTAQLPSKASARGLIPGACKAATRSSALKASSQENGVRPRCLVLRSLFACVLPAALGVSQSPFESTAHVKRATVVCGMERWAKYSTKKWGICLKSHRESTGK